MGTVAKASRIASTAASCVCASLVPVYGPAYVLAWSGLGRAVGSFAPVVCEKSDSRVRASVDSIRI